MHPRKRKPPRDATQSARRSPPNARPAVAPNKAVFRLGLILSLGAVGVGAVTVFFVRRGRPPSPVAVERGNLAVGPASVGALFNGHAALTNAQALAGTDRAQPRVGEKKLSDAELAVELLTHGNELLAGGKTDEAIREYERSLRYDAGSEDTHYNLGIALAKAGRDEEAIQHYREALRILPDYAEAHNNLGNLLVKTGRLDEAIGHFNTALDLNPDSASTHNNLGTALGRQGKLPDATIHFAKAVQLLPSYVEAHYNLGNAYVAQGELRQAIEQFRETLRLQPDFAPAARALAKIMQPKTP